MNDPITSNSLQTPIHGFTRDITTRATAKSAFQDVLASTREPQEPEEAPSGVGIMERVYGSDFKWCDTFDMEEFKARTVEANYLFNREFTARLRQAGINVDSSLSLGVDEMDNVKVLSDSPDKERIERLFREDQVLADDFRGTSRANDMIAQADLNSRYCSEYQSQTTDEDRLEVWRRYEDMYGGMDKLLVQLRFDNGQLVSPAREYESRLVG